MDTKKDNNLRGREVFWSNSVVVTNTMIKTNLGRV